MDVATVMKMIMKERKRVTIRKRILGDQMLKFKIGIPMIDEVCNNETIDKIMELFSTLN